MTSFPSRENFRALSLKFEKSTYHYGHKCQFMENKHRGLWLCEVLATFPAKAQGVSCTNRRDQWRAADIDPALADRNSAITTTRHEADSVPMRLDYDLHFCTLRIAEYNKCSLSAPTGRTPYKPQPGFHSLKSLLFPPILLCSMEQRQKKYPFTIPS